MCTLLQAKNLTIARNSLQFLSKILTAYPVMASHGEKLSKALTEFTEKYDNVQNLKVLVSITITISATFTNTITVTVTITITPTIAITVTSTSTITVTTNTVTIAFLSAQVMSMRTKTQLDHQRPKWIRDAVPEAKAKPKKRPVPQKPSKVVHSNHYRHHYHHYSYHHHHHQPWQLNLASTGEDPSRET